MSSRQQFITYERRQKLSLIGKQQLKWSRPQYFGMFSLNSTAQTTRLTLSLISFCERKMILSWRIFLISGILLPPFPDAPGRAWCAGPGIQLHGQQTSAGRRCERYYVPYPQCRVASLYTLVEVPDRFFLSDKTARYDRMFHVSTKPRIWSLAHTQYSGICLHKQCIQCQPQFDTQTWREHVESSHPRDHHRSMQSRLLNNRKVQSLVIFHRAQYSESEHSAYFSRTHMQLQCQHSSFLLKESLLF